MWCRCAGWGRLIAESSQGWLDVYPPSLLLLFGVLVVELWLGCLGVCLYFIIFWNYVFEEPMSSHRWCILRCWDDDFYFVYFMNPLRLFYDYNDLWLFWIIDNISNLCDYLLNFLLNMLLGFDGVTNTMLEYYPPKMRRKLLWSRIVLVVSMWSVQWRSRKEYGCVGCSVVMDVDPSRWVSRRRRIVPANTLALWHQSQWEMRWMCVKYGKRESYLRGDAMWPLYRNVGEKPSPWNVAPLCDPNRSYRLKRVVVRCSLQSLTCSFAVVG